LTTYVNTFRNGQTKESDVDLGYPWIPTEDAERPPSFELAVETAAAILAYVGDDPELAQEALDRELSREFPPRKVLTSDLRRIIRNAES